MSFDIGAPGEPGVLRLTENPEVSEVVYLARGRTGARTTSSGDRSSGLVRALWALRSAPIATCSRRTNERLAREKR
jgi:hypothetical protein